MQEMVKKTIFRIFLIYRCYKLLYEYSFVEDALKKREMISDKI